MAGYRSEGLPPTNDKSGYITAGADLENEKKGFFCMRTLRAGENFAQSQRFPGDVLLTV